MDHSPSWPNRAARRSPVFRVCIGFSIGSLILLAVPAAAQLPVVSVNSDSPLWEVLPSETTLALEVRDVTEFETDLQRLNEKLLPAFPVTQFVVSVLRDNIEAWGVKQGWAEVEPAVMFGSALPRTNDDREEPGFTSLFDGQTLEGWQAVPASTAAAWTIADGILVGNGDHGVGYLVYTRDKQLANFELRLRYRFVGRGNSGISLRAAPDRSGKRLFQSYHADLGHVGIGKQILGAWDFHTPGRTEHRCHRGDRLVISAEDQPQIAPIQDGLRAEDIRPGDWNEVRIIARDNHFQFFINGKLASEFTEHLPAEQRLLNGMLQLQIHDPGMIVHFKDLRIKRE